MCTYLLLTLAGPELEDDTPSDVLSPVGDDMPYDPLNADEPVVESFDRVSSRASKKQEAETKKKVQEVDDDEVLRFLLCPPQHLQPLMHEHLCTNFRLKTGPQI